MNHNDLIQLVVKVLELLIGEYKQNNITREQFIEHCREKINYLQKIKDNDEIIEANKTKIDLILSKYNSLID